jgi:hemolysin D
MNLRHCMAAYGALWQRSLAVFGHCWQHRESLGGGMFNAQEAEFMPAALSLQERPASSSARLTGWLLMALVAMALLWSVLGKIDIIVNANGKVVPSERTKTIASVDVAAVRAVHVQEGRAVKAGDLLLELDTSAPDAERDKAEGDAMAATLEIARSRALIAAIDSLTPPRLPGIDGVSESALRAAGLQLAGQYQDFRAKLSRIDGDIARYAEALPLAAQRAGDYRSLAQDHDVSEHAWLEKEQARIDLQGQLTDARRERAALVAQTRKDAQQALTDSSKAAAESGEDAKRAGAHGKLLQLRSPVDGTVQQLDVHTVGGVVPAAQPLMLIVPRTDRIEVEAFVENKDIGFVDEGQPVEVKIDAFDYTRYGTVAAHLTHVSRDAIKDEKKGLLYSVRIVLDQTAIAVDGKTLPLSAGMSVDAEIKTGTRRVIAYVLSPLLAHQREALHER